MENNDVDKIKKEIENFMRDATKEEAIEHNPELMKRFLALGKVATEFGTEALMPKEDKKPPQKFALFYGFNGVLEKKYSVITDKTEEEIRTRMLMIKTTVAWSIHRWEEFENIVKQFEGTPNQLIEILFEDAMSIIRNGQKNEFEKFIEAEMEEFTDKCIAGKCKPGDHYCGKK